MKAVVLCAGKGRRIRDITNGEIPKPMIEVDGVPILEYTLSSLESQNIDEVLINLHHKGGVIEDYFGSIYGSMDIKYFWEESLRGTSGSLAQMKDNLNGEFLVIYGDIVTNLVYEDINSFHRSKDSIGTVVTYSGEENLSEASILQLDGHYINSFIEKPNRSQIEDVKGKMNVWTNASIYCFDTEVLEFIPENGKQDFGNDLFPKILTSDYKLSAYRVPKDTYWREVGRPTDYENLVQDVSKNKIEWL